MPITYEQAGVSISRGDQFVRQIKASAKSTYTRGVLGDLGAFGGFYRAKFSRMRMPVLVSSVDGVGTKLLVAQAIGRHETVGQDLVNHCVNDILVCGASPLYFLDYIATGKLDVASAAGVVSGLAKACRENGCALIGGETAEMPDMYGENTYDLAGAIVGVVEKSRIVSGKAIRKGDLLIGLPSTGLHTNGFSLARRVLLQRFRLEEQVDELGSTLGDALLAVHRSYLKPVSAVLRASTVSGLSHITGGGIVGNTMRVVPRGRSLKIDWGSWERPPLFALIQKLGDVPEEDMRRTFNLGIGLVMIVPRAAGNRVLRILRRFRETPTVIGEVA